MSPFLTEIQVTIFGWTIIIKYYKTKWPTRNQLSINYRSTSIHNSPLFPGEIRVKHQAKAKVKVDEAAPPVAAKSKAVVSAKAGVIWWGFHLQLVGGDWNMNVIFPFILGIIIIPTDELTPSYCSEGVRQQPPTRLLTIINHIVSIIINSILTVYYPLVGRFFPPTRKGLSQASAARPAKAKAAAQPAPTVTALGTEDLFSCKNDGQWLI